MGLLFVDFSVFIFLLMEFDRGLYCEARWAASCTSLFYSVWTQSSFEVKSPYTCTLPSILRTLFGPFQCILDNSVYVEG
jgi:hypothetical protein